MDTIDASQKIIAGFLVLAIVVLVWQIVTLLGSSAPQSDVEVHKSKKNVYTVKHVTKKSWRIGDVQQGVVK